MSWYQVLNLVPVKDSWFEMWGQFRRQFCFTDLYVARDKKDKDDLIICHLTLILPSLFLSINVTEQTPTSRIFPAFWDTLSPYGAVLFLENYDFILINGYMTSMWLKIEYTNWFLFTPTFPTKILSVSGMEDHEEVKNINVLIQGPSMWYKHLRNDRFVWEWLVESCKLYWPHQ